MPLKKFFMGTSMKQIFFLYNVLGFKVCWWACVLGAINGQKFLGPLLVGLYLLVHLYMIPEALRKSEVFLLVVAGIFGTIADSLLLNTNILVYDGMYSSVDFIAPLWITAMWVGFTATLNHAFKNIIKKYFIQMILGAVAGPMD